jgi:hypothetical protein
MFAQNPDFLAGRPNMPLCISSPSLALKIQFPFLNIQSPFLDDTNRDLIHGLSMNWGNHPFCSAASVVQRQRREYLQNHSLQWVANVGVSGLHMISNSGFATESAGHRNPNASIADPHF